MKTQEGPGGAMVAKRSTWTRIGEKRRGEIDGGSLRQG